ncbi:MAG: hypothetical protein R3A52_02655 [Polyangiales bacterium]
MAPGGDEFQSSLPPPPSELDPLYRVTVRRTLESHGCRALALASWFGRGIELLSDARWLRFAGGCARECVHQLHRVGRVYEALAGEALEPVAHARLMERTRDQARGADDFAVGSVVLLRGWFEVLREHDRCSYLPYREAVGAMVHEVDARMVLAEQFLSEQARATEPEAMRAMVMRWAPRAEADLGPRTRRAWPTPSRWG